MSSRDSKTFDLTPRVDREIRRERLRLGSAIAGAGFMVLGIFAVRPFGPPLSNSVAIPKADPNAGLWLAQALPSGTVRILGVALIVLGIILLAASKLLGASKSPNTSLERTRER